MVVSFPSFSLVSGHFPGVSTPNGVLLRKWRTMGTIVPRKRKNGSQAYRAQIVRKQGGKIVYRETQTFDRKQAAQSLAGSARDGAAGTGRGAYS
jgi:hypothetical protein